MSGTSREIFQQGLFAPLETWGGQAILGPETIPYPDLLRRIDRLERRLRAAGVQEWMRVGLCVDQTPGYVIALLAILRMGAKALLLSPTWTSDEVRRCLAATQPSFFMADQPLSALDPQQFSGLDPRFLVAGDLEGAAIGLQESELRLIEVGGERVDPCHPDDAVVIFTSGTSGTPKGVVLSARGLLANVSAVREYLGVEEADSALLFTPTCYAYAVSQVLVQALGRAAICPIRRGLKYPIVILEAIARHGIRGVSANPTSFKILTSTRTDGSLDLSSLRYAQSGGQFLAVDLVETIRTRFPNSRVVNQYGCTENSPRICFHWVRDDEAPLPGCSITVGRAVRGTEVLVAAEGAVPAPAGEQGQLLVRGTSLMSRYWQMPEQTASRFIDGWYMTGDLARLDGEGGVVIVGRLTDVINVGNEKVTPGEVEAFLQEVDGVEEAGVFGVADALYGEGVEAIIVPTAGSSPTEEELSVAVRAHLRSLLSPFKIPRRIHIRPDLPRTLYGKLDRRRLPEWVSRGTAA